MIGSSQKGTTTVSLLLVDHSISKDKVQNVICRLCDQQLLDFGAELRKHIAQDGPLTEEMNRYIQAGEVIPAALLEKFIQSLLKEMPAGNILLSGYPRSREQYEGLVRLLDSSGIAIGGIWVIKQRDPNAFLEAYFKDPGKKGWLDKYGEETIERMRTEFVRIRAQIDTILAAAGDKKVKTIEMDYEPGLSEAGIENKIRGAA